MNTVHESPPPARAAESRDDFFEAAKDAMRTPPDWERLIEQGAPPALALGAERRLKR
jgi:hypothetical protein